MAKVSEKQKRKELVEELRKRDAMALALLIYDIYQEKKRKEKNDDLSQSICHPPHILNKLSETTAYNI